MRPIFVLIALSTLSGCSTIGGAALEGLGHAMQCIGSQGYDCTAQYAPPPYTPVPPTTPMPAPPVPPPPGSPGGLLCPGCYPRAS